MIRGKTTEKGENDQPLPLIHHWVNFGCDPNAL